MGDEKDKDGHKSSGIVKQGAEVVQILDGLTRKWWDDLAFWFDKEGRKKAAAIQEELGELRFDSTEFRSILDRMVEGTYPRDAADRLTRLLVDSAIRVNIILLGLKKHKRFIDRRFSPGFYDRIDDDVMKMKRDIRRDIEALTGSRKTKAEKVELAASVLADIEKFNRNLADIRSIMAPPKIKIDK